MTAQNIHTAPDGNQPDFRDFFLAAPDPTLILGDGPAVLLANQAARELLGEVVGLNPARIDVYLGQARLADLQALVPQAPPLIYDGLVRTAAGGLLPVEVTAVRLPSGRLVQIFKDASERSLLQGAVDRAEDACKTLFDLAHDGAAVFDGSGALLFANKAMAELLGPRRTPPEGLIADLIPGAPGREFARMIQKALAAEDSLDFDFQTEIGGRGRHWTVRVSPAVYGRDAKPVVLCFCRDVTHAKLLGEGLAKAKEAEASAQKAKNDFLASVGHEIQTPLNAVVGLTELLLLSPLGDAEREWAEAMLTSARNLSTLLGGVMDYAALSGKRVELDAAPFDPVRTIESLAKVYAAQARKKRLAFRLDLAPDLARTVVGDESKFRQVLVNLIGNALKFTEKGEIRVFVQSRAVKPAAGGAGAVRLLVSVIDTGVGVPAEVKPKLFEAFTQGDSGLSRRFGGLGLGLAGAKRLVRLMNGDVWFESEAHKGSAFYFSVLFALPGDESVKAHVRAKPAKILLAEANPLTRGFLANKLEYLGHRVFEVSNGVEALAELAREKYDVVFLDLHMPVMDGLTAASAVRAADGAAFAPNIPIVGMAPSGVRGERTDFIRAGFNEFLQKPIEARSIEAVLAQLLGTP